MKAFELAERSFKILDQKSDILERLLSARNEQNHESYNRVLSEVNNLTLEEYSALLNIVAYTMNIYQDILDDLHDI